MTACLLAFAYYAKPRQKTVISFRDAFLIGAAQACAVLPGLSRSGSTIATGILLGNNKENVAKFSFLMVLVPILGEALLEVKDMFTEADGANVVVSFVPLLIGFCAAFYFRFPGLSVDAEFSEKRKIDLVCRVLFGCGNSGFDLPFFVICANGWRMQYYL